MITAIQAYLDAHAAGAAEVAADWLRHLPAWQVEIRFVDFAPACPDRIEPELPRRPGNCLAVEVGAPLPRCRQRTPRHWGDFDHRATRWLLSGGSPLVLGPCSASGCPRARAVPGP